MNENETPTPRTDGSIWETDHENPCGPIEVVSADSALAAVKGGGK